jgi:hypothetical protein
VSLAERDVMEEELIIRVAKNFVVTSSLNSFIALLGSSQLFKILV